MDVNPEPFDMKALVTYCCATVSPLLEEKPDVKLEQDVADGMKLMKRRRLKLRGIWSGSGQKQGKRFGIFTGRVMCLKRKKMKSRM